MFITDPRKAVVASGYDVIAERYLEWTGGAQVRNHYLQQFYDLVPAGGHVLDLGCGAGVPVAKKLAERASVVGVDISATQVVLARQKSAGSQLHKCRHDGRRVSSGIFRRNICVFFSHTFAT